MHVLVTGGTGFIGRQLVRRLLTHNIRVTILLRQDYAEGKPLPDLLRECQSQFGVVYADLQDQQQTHLAIRQTTPTHVVHLAAAGVTTPFLPIETALAHNLDATLNLIHACFDGRSEHERPKQIIVGRTPGEHTAMNVYAASKAATWQFCKMFVRTKGWPIHGAMIFQAYGPCQPEKNLIPAAIKAACSNQDFPMTSGSQARDWIYLDDIVRALHMALDKPMPPGTTCELGTGQATSVAEVVQAIYRISNSNGRPLIGAIPNRPGEDLIQTADATATKRHIGWEPRITLEQGLRQLLGK